MSPRGGKRPGAGRKKRKVDWDVFKRLASFGATCAEICDTLKLDDKTISARCREEHGMGFDELRNHWDTGGKIALRQAQMQTAIEDRNPTMLIWLGKQRLGQTDSRDLNLHHASANRLAHLSREQLLELRERVRDPNDTEVLLELADGAVVSSAPYDDTDPLPDPDDPNQ